MATITGHYNVTVDSRYYAFLQDDLESVEPHVLIANVEKKRELRKENKTKAKKEKRKQIAEAIKENNKVESNVEEVIKFETEIVESKPEIVEKVMEIQESVIEEKPVEPKYDRTARGRGNSRRQNGGPRRGGYQRNDERTYNDEVNHQKSQDSEYGRFSSNNRGRPFRKERSEGDNSGKFGYFEDQSGGNSRGSSIRRRSSGRPGGRYSRGSDRSNYDRNSNEKYGSDRNGDRNGYDKNLNERNKNDNEDSARIDIIPENMGTFEDMSSSRPPRSSRGRYPRSNRGGSFNRYHGQNNENDFEITRIDHFDENMENREFRGGRGRFRGRGMRRGRGEPWRRGNDREENRDDGSNNFKPENHDVPPVEKWPESEEEPNPESNNNDPNLNANLPQTDFNDMKKSNWGEIEDDPVDLKPSEHMTLEEYRALHSKDRLINQEGKENRKANDGQDVFSGMEEYRKGKCVEEQGDEHDNHENQHGRQKQSIPVAIRFSRNTEYGESNNFEVNSTENKSFSRGYYRNDNRFRDNSSATGRGRSRGGSDFNTYGRGRDFNRGESRRGRFNRSSYPVKSKEDQVDGVNINLGNEEEFPTLS